MKTAVVIVLGALVATALADGKFCNEPQSDKTNITVPLRLCNMQRYLKFVKMIIFKEKKEEDILHIFAQNIHCRYTLEPPRPQ